MQIKFLLPLIFLTSCDYRVAKQVDGNRVNTKPTASISFAEVNIKVFQPKCSECHDFSSYSSVKAVVSTMRDYVVSGFMPKAGAAAGSLTQVEKAFLIAWIDQGAPEFAESTGANPSSDPTPSPTSQPDPEDHGHHHCDDLREKHHCQTY